MVQEILNKAHLFETNQNMFFKDCPYFPSIKTNRVGLSELWVGTIKRVLHEGKWYKWKFLDIDYSCDAIEGDNGLKATKRLMVQVYLCDTYGQVDPNLKEVNGKPIFELDENQEDEFNRMSVYLGEEFKKTVKR